MSRLETPEAMAARLAGGGSVTAATVRGILADTIRERDAAILARLDACLDADGVWVLSKLDALRAELRRQP